MRIAVVGTGYVGLVTGTCFAISGNTVTCLDINAEKIARLNRGEIPIYEPGLEELVVRSAKAGRLLFTTDTATAIRAAQVVFLAVGTPPSADGSADLSSLWKVVDSIAPHLDPEAVVVTKSTVPVGTCAGIEARLKERTGRECQVASNPEFLKEGAAIDDFQKPDRVVVGVRSAAVGEILRSLYKPFLRTEHPFLVMSPESSEMTKYVANSLLATKISFINEVANLCERMEADIDDVRRGIGHDKRIGFSFLFPGVGYGGSCFPKDVQALAAMARDKGVAHRILTAVHETNLAQKQVLGEKIIAHFGGQLAGRRIAVVVATHERLRELFLRAGRGRREHRHCATQAAADLHAAQFTHEGRRPRGIRHDRREVEHAVAEHLFEARLRMAVAPPGEPAGEGPARLRVGERQALGERDRHVAFAAGGDLGGDGPVERRHDLANERRIGRGSGVDDLDFVEPQAFREAGTEHVADLVGLA